jgi:hypothetical protein
MPNLLPEGSRARCVTVDSSTPESMSGLWVSALGQILYFHGNPVVHSLSVTLGNHTILSTPPYNYSCPKDHLLILGLMPMEWLTGARTLVL